MKTTKSSEPGATTAPPATTADVKPMVPARLHLKTILVPVDFSEASRKSLHYAASFAKQFKSELRLVYVVEPVPYLAGLEAVPIVMPENELAQQVGAKIAALAKAEVEIGIPTTHEVRRGSSYQEIVAAAKECQADLIIISTHGYTGWEHALLGSTAEKIVQHAPCPVLVVRQIEREFVG